MKCETDMKNITIGLIDKDVDNLEIVCQKIRFWAELNNKGIELTCKNTLEDRDFYNIIFLCIDSKNYVKRIQQIHILSQLLTVDLLESDSVGISASLNLTHDIKIPKQFRTITLDRQLVFLIDLHTDDIFDILKNLLDAVVI